MDDPGDTLLFRLDGYCSAVVKRASGHVQLNLEELDRCIEALGRKLRRNRAAERARA